MSFPDPRGKEPSKGNFKVRLSSFEEEDALRYDGEFSKQMRKNEKVRAGFLLSDLDSFLTAKLEKMIIKILTKWHDSVWGFRGPS